MGPHAEIQKLNMTCAVKINSSVKTQCDTGVVFSQYLVLDQLLDTSDSDKE